MARLAEIAAYADTLLQVNGYKDYCPNGLQVEAAPDVHKLVAGVTASAALIEAAIGMGADLLLVHHGFFWKGEDPRIVGMKARRVGLLLRHGISLIAYHLPLDGHPELGNNAILGARLGAVAEGRLGESVGMFGSLGSPQTPQQFAVRLADALGREPLHLEGGPAAIQRIGWCSGAAQDYIFEAAALGLDAYVSGEVSERTVHEARELGIHYFAAGHHATERWGADALGRHLADRFGVAYEFVDIANPV